MSSVGVLHDEFYRHESGTNGYSLLSDFSHSKFRSCSNNLQIHLNQAENVCNPWVSSLSTSDSFRPTQSTIPLNSNSSPLNDVFMGASNVKDNTHTSSSTLNKNSSFTTSYPPNKVFGNFPLIESNHARLPIFPCFLPSAKVHSPCFDCIRGMTILNKERGIRHAYGRHSSPNKEDDCRLRQSKVDSIQSHGHGFMNESSLEMEDENKPEYEIFSGGSHSKLESKFDYVLNCIANDKRLLKFLRSGNHLSPLQRYFTIHKNIKRKSLKNRQNIASSLIKRYSAARSMPSF